MKEAARVGTFPPPAKRRGQKMQRTDGSYLYNLGRGLQPLHDVEHGYTYAQAYTTLIWAESALDLLLHQSIYKLRHSLQSGENLLSWVRAIKAKAVAATDFAND